MKIAYIAVSEDVDAHHAGLTHSRGMCRGLVENDAEVFLFLRGTNASQKIVNGVTEIVLPRRGLWKPLWGKDARAWEDARRIIASCDVVHERYSVNPLSRWLAGGKHVFLEINDPLSKTWSGVKKWLFFPLIVAKKKNVLGVVTQTQTLANLLKEDFDSIPIRVISNGVDVKSFNHSTLHKRHPPGKNPIVVFVGSFREWHGVESIPLIAKRVHEKIPGIKFILLGGGPLFENVSQIVRDEGLEKIIEMRGPIPFDGVKDILLRSHVGVAPFLVKENTPLAHFGFWWCPVKLFEYIGAGLPVVASDFEEVRTIVGKAGILTPQGNNQAMADAIIHLLTDHTLWKKCHEAAMKTAPTFAWNRLAKSLITFYQERM